MKDAIARSRSASHIGDRTLRRSRIRRQPQEDDALRSTVVGLSIAVAPGEAYYFRSSIVAHPV